jgi:WD40 repeat protein
MAGNRCLSTSNGGQGNTYFNLRDLHDGKEVRQWRRDHTLWIRLCSATRNGLYAPVWASWDSSAPGRVWEESEARIGLWNQETNEPGWIATLHVKQPSMELLIREVTASEDGRYLAVAGWKHGVAMIDAVGRKVLWENRPEDEVWTEQVVFSPTSPVVYASGGVGCVHVMDVKTGKVLDQWWITPPGDGGSPRRVTAMAMAPDGRWLAAGTGPEGLVCLIALPTGKRYFMSHPDSPILIASFSPDSQRLATVGSGTLKLWRVASVVQNIDAAGNR